jgi:hypothetical protein
MLLLSLLLCLLWVGAPAVAQGPITPEHSDPTWQASYWNNANLSGQPVLQQSEPNIDYDWGTGSPAPGLVNSDYFSARWTRYIDVAPGSYRFTVTSDDGVRVWVDGDLILDAWYDHPPQTFTADVDLSEGHHLIKVAYYEKTGLAVAKVAWQRQGVPPSTVWQAEYFNNVTLSGTPALTREDAVIDFDWGVGSPAPGTVNTDNFSVRWTQTRDMPAAMYTFALRVDDGARLWVNGHLLIDAWKDQAPTPYTGDLYLPGGPVTLEVQYYERGGGAVAQLSWSTGGSPPPSPDAVIVDDLDPEFVRGGPAGDWRTAAEGHNGHLTWTLNHYDASASYNWARWYPVLQARRYEVFVYVPDRYTTTGQARYWVNHADGYTLRVVSQSATGGQWVSLGTYRFRGTNEDYVSLADVTFEPSYSRLVAFDAVKWVPR